MFFKIVKSFLGKISILLPDKTFLKAKFRYHTGKKLNLNQPRTFNEKIQWLKLYDRRPEYITYVDKYAVRSYVSETIGEQYLIPLLGVYESVEEIDWDALPNQFVLKCTHGSGSNIICADKNALDIELSKRKLKKWMKRNWFWYGREWPYKYINPRIICEQFLFEETKEQSLTDYKFFCFNGIPKYCQVIRERGRNETIDFYDIEWNHMPFNGLRNFPKSTNKYLKPEKYDLMLKLAQQLSVAIPFARVDFYYIKNIKSNVYFGELTLHPTSGFGKFYPDIWNEKIGELIELPKKMIEILNLEKP